jgi:hypothetical protein
MGFIEKHLDLRKFARALNVQPEAPTARPDPDAMAPEELIPCLYDAYIQILRSDAVDITKLDFDAISEGDIDDLANVLSYSPAHDLYAISDVLMRFEPATAAGRVFI